MMDFLELAKERYSVRKFKKEAVTDEQIEQILKAGHLAPTACNNQPQKIIVVKSEEGLEKLRKCTECHFNAPLVFIVGYDKTRSWKRSYDGQDSGYVDASIVTTHMMLEAANVGLGSTWVMYFIPEAIKVEFELDETFEPVAVLPVGIPAEDAKPAKMHEMYREEGEIVTES